jgi:hypothetical protein
VQGKNAPTSLLYGFGKKDSGHLLRDLEARALLLWSGYLKLPVSRFLSLLFFTLHLFAASSITCPTTSL